MKRNIIGKNCYHYSKRLFLAILLMFLVSFPILRQNFSVSTHKISDNSINFKSLQDLSVREQIGANYLINLGYNGSNIKIGIIDTGINPNHPEFSGKQIDQKSFVSIQNGYSANIISPTDTLGHGTLVTGIAAGVDTGIAPGAALAIAKIYEKGIKGNGGYIDEETSRGIYEAITWLAKEENVSIINLSLGQYHNLVNEGRGWYIDQITKQYGVLFVISAANDGIDGINLASLSNPGAALQAITVGMSDGISAMNLESSNGPRPDWSMKPDLVAPGTDLQGPSFSGAGYTSCTGTSCSAPVITGASALLMSALKILHINYTPGTIKAALMSTASPIIQNTINRDSYPW
ncbi:MAG: S8 family serine peptidase, partial [Candidatus Thorarchaeota archaeon]